MTGPRVLVLDLDGTTLTADRRIAPIDVAAARALREAGIAVTIATGRLYTGTRWVAEALGVEGSVAVMNGSELIDVATDRTVHGQYLDAPVRRAVRSRLEPLGLAGIVFESRRIHYGARDHRLAPYLSIWTEHLTAHDDLLEAPPWDDSPDVVALAAAGPTGAIHALRAALAEVLPPEVETLVFSTFDGETFLKLRHCVDDKGTALARLAAERGFGVEDCVAVGDWLNDLPMLRAAGRSFAMAHAGDAVKDAADEVLVASRDGGAIAEVAARVWGITV
ncbi:MAG: HAD family hydrolase [Myxococcota bacterium]